MAAVQHGPPFSGDNPHIFVRGADGILYVRWGTGNGWNAWQSLNESYVGTPSIVSATIDVDYGATAGFVIFFRAPDNSLRYLKIAEGSPGPIPDPPVSQRLGGSLTSSPTAVSWDHYHRLDVFVRDINGALQTVASANQGDTWTNFVSLGGGFTGDPFAVSRSTNTIDVFVRGSGNTLYTLPWNGQAWTGWAAITSPFLASPAAVAWSSTRLDVFVRGTDSTLKHKAWNAGGPWLPTNGFEAMGGTVQ